MGKGSDESSEDSGDSSDGDEMTTPPKRRSRPRRAAGRGVLSAAESESEEEEAHTRRVAKRVRLARLKAITPPEMATGEAVKVLFKAKPTQEAASYEVPADFDNDEEHEAYLERAGRAVAWLKEAHGEEWLRGCKPKDVAALWSMREEQVDIVSRRGDEKGPERARGELGEPLIAVVGWLPGGSPGAGEENAERGSSLVQRAAARVCGTGRAAQACGRRRPCSCRRRRGSRNPYGTGVFAR